MSLSIHSPLNVPGSGKLALSECRLSQNLRPQDRRPGASANFRNMLGYLDVVAHESGAQPVFLGQTAKAWLQRTSADNHELAGHVEARWLDFIQRDWDKLHPLFEQARTSTYASLVDHCPFGSALLNELNCLGMSKASAEQWRSTIQNLTKKGISQDEIQTSGALVFLESCEPKESVTLADISAQMDFRAAIPRLVHEHERLLDAGTGQWIPCNTPLNGSQLIRAGLANRKSATEWIQKYAHRTYGWRLCQAQFNDLIEPEEECWCVLDHRGQREPKFRHFLSSAKLAARFAEYRMGRLVFKDMREALAVAWQTYTTAHSPVYHEFILQLDDWFPTYRSEHFNARNPLVHMRVSVRTTKILKRILFIEEIQSDWHRDLGLGRDKTPDAPFRKEWPLLAIKCMIWWAQKYGFMGVALSTMDIQNARWPFTPPPRSLYEDQIPKACKRLPKTLDLEYGSTTVRDYSTFVQRDNSRGRWVLKEIADEQSVQVFSSREEAEAIADSEGLFTERDVPTIWIEALPKVRRVPLFGIASRSFWTEPNADCAIPQKPLAALRTSHIRNKPVIELDEEEFELLSKTHSAVCRYGEQEITKLVRKVIYRMQRTPTAICFEDCLHKSLWDEYCHHTQEGPFDDSLESAFETTAMACIHDVIEGLPPHSAALLSIYAADALDEHDQHEIAGSVCCDVMRQLLKQFVDEKAGERDIQRMGPNRVFL